ncbi:MAG: polysaccharide biosynthesis C-terminal domain-containing protein [Candidatus Edwardsbacteria bacterium]|nr:polysaccharide biosynthesis C-terminal domain-containing protein [Candidatus Edwardsbacteria bacterium]
MLRDHLKTVSWETAIYGLGGAASSLVSFLLLPLYVHYLSPQDYGYLTLFAICQSLVQLLAGFGLAAGLFRYYLLAADEGQRAAVLRTCLWYQIGLIVLTGMLAGAVAGRASLGLFGSAGQHHLMLLASGAALSFVASQFGFILMRAERRPLLYVTSQLVRVFLLAGTGIYWVAIAKQSYRGVVIGTFVSELAVGIGMVCWLSGHRLLRLPAPAPAHFTTRLTKFIGPVFLINLAYFVLTMADRFFIEHFSSAEQVGLYSFGSKIGSVVLAGLIMPFSMAVFPYALAISHQDHFRATYSRIIHYFMIVAGCASLTVFAFSRELTALLAAPAYASAAGVVGLVLLGWLFYGLYYAISIALDIVERTDLALAAVTSGAVASLLLNWLLIPRWGMYGAALTGCLANGLMLALMYRFCQRSYRMPYDLRTCGLLLFLLLALAGCLLAVDRILAPQFFRVTAKAGILLAVLPAALWRLGVPAAADWHTAGNWLKRRIARASP